MLLIFFTMIAICFLVSSCPEKKKVPPTPNPPEPQIEPQVDADIETEVT